MADDCSFNTRRRIMAAVPQKNSKPELLLRKELYRQGLRYRLHCVGLPGRPDVVFPKARVAVFVHGCFWHRHEGCPKTTFPKTNVEFWTAKFEANVKRDRRNSDDLQALGWRVVIVWECEIKRALGEVAEAVTRVVKA